MYEVAFAKAEFEQKDTIVVAFCAFNIQKWGILEVYHIFVVELRDIKKFEELELDKFHLHSSCTKKEPFVLDPIWK